MAGGFVAGAAFVGDNRAIAEIMLCGLGFNLGALLYHLSESPALPLTSQLRLALVLPIAIVLSVAVQAFQALAVVNVAFVSCVFLAAALLMETLPAVTKAAARIAWLGDLTYSSYLVHFPIQLIGVISFDALGLPRSLFLQPLALAGFLVVVMGVAHIVFQCFERPAQTWLRDVLLRRPARVPADAT